MYQLLAGIRILDMCRLIPGDACTQVLADLGADVIKLEEPPTGDYLRSSLGPFLNGVGWPYLTLNRNKRSMSLNLKTDAGREVFRRLVATADAIVQVSKPGVFEKLGADYASVAALKPDIVYCEMSAYGQDGPWKMFPAHGYNIAAMSGQVEVEWDADGRPQLPRDLGRRGAGGGQGLSAAVATLGAIIQRLRTGKGEYIDSSGWDDLVANSSGLRDWLNDMEPMMDRLDLRNAPRYNVYLTLDRQVIFLCPIERKFWVSFCEVVDRRDWIGRATFEGHMDWGNYDVTLRDEMQDIIATKNAAEWLALFLAADVPAAPVLTSPEAVAATGHFAARQMMVETTHAEYGDIRLLRPAAKLPDQPFTIRYPPPMLGEHTEALLEELGYDEAGVAALRAQSAI